MRIVMPLFQFFYIDDEFEFSDPRFSIRHFVPPSDLDTADFLSKNDIARICQAQWALVANIAKDQQYKKDVSLVLMAFRILATDLSPFIGFRLHEKIQDSVRMTEILAFPHIEIRLHETYDFQKLTLVNQAYNVLFSARSISTRVSNAFYFLYSSFNSTHWIHAFVFMMSALESLFSKDAPGGATRTVCERVAGLLSDPEITVNTLNQLYAIRSRIVHGDIEAHENPNDNLDDLFRLERITIMCFRKMIDQRSFDHYATQSQRDAFLNQFDGPLDPMTRKAKILLEIEQSIH